MYEHLSAPGRIGSLTIKNRMAMTAAVCSLICAAPAVIPGAECVEKSYPTFWKDWEVLQSGLSFHSA